MRNSLCFSLVLALAMPTLSWGLKPEECRFKFEALQIWELEDLIRHHGDFSPTTRVENEAYLLRLRSREQPPWAVLHADITNLKWQNDDGLGRKNLVNAAENLYRRLLWESVLTNPLTAPYVDQNFSDFKTSRFVFNEVPKENRPEFTRALEKMMETAAEQHEKQLNSYLSFSPEIRDRLRREPLLSLNRHVGRWHGSGLAIQRVSSRSGEELADLASLRARFSRKEVSGGKKTLPLKTTDEGILDALDSYQSAYHDALRGLRELKPQRSSLVTTHDRNLVPSEELLEILRKYPEDAEVEIQAHFGVKLPRETLQALRTAFDTASLFSPSITQVDRLVPTPNGYTISVDFRGVGTKNQQLLMSHLGRASRQGTAEDQIFAAIASARQSEREATAWVEQLKANVVEAAQAGAIADDPKRVVFTGDDGMIEAERPFDHKSVDVRQFFLKALISFGKSNANQYRLVMLNNSELSESEKFHTIFEMESLLKRMARKFDPPDLNVAIAVTPTAGGGGQVRFYFTGKQVDPSAVDRLLLSAARELPIGYKLAPPHPQISYGVRP